MVSPDTTQYDLHPQAIITLPIPLAILSTIAISLRIWIRCFLTRSFGRDDICLLISHVKYILTYRIWATLTNVQIWFLAACAVFIAIGLTEYTSGLASLVKLAEVCAIFQSCYTMKLTLRLVEYRRYRLVPTVPMLLQAFYGLFLSPDRKQTYPSLDH